MQSSLSSLAVMHYTFTSPVACTFCTKVKTTDEKLKKMQLASKRSRFLEIHLEEWTCILLLGKCFLGIFYVM